MSFAEIVEHIRYHHMVGNFSLISPGNFPVQSALLNFGKIKSGGFKLAAFPICLLLLLLSDSPVESEPEKSSASVPKLLQASNSDDCEIEYFDFGVVTDRSGPTKSWRLHPVVVIPNLPGVQYAWKIRLKSKQPVFVREEFTLPEAPSTWKIKEGEASSQLLKGGEQCVLESFQSTDDGWLGHSWTASNGDPAGKYEIRILLNGKLAHVFTFNVGEAMISENDGREF
ncbi:MAG: hypothetical protein K2X27_06545 [Candidatus Obscuribacterales bacterium]|nr:hypothetical protein [Candidatus Obscuribacterales bacterium]